MSVRSILKKNKARRDRIVDEGGTGEFSFLNSGDIDIDTNSGGWLIDFSEESKTDSWYPFENIHINNTSASDVFVYLNQNHNLKKTVRAGMIQSFKDKGGLRTVRVSKSDAAVTVVAGEVEVTVYNDALNVDKAVRREQTMNPIKKIIGNLLGF